MPRIDQYAAQPVGRTVRLLPPLSGTGRPSIAAVLVTDDSLASHFWLNILSLAQANNMRHFMTLSDFRGMAPRLHVRPQQLPAFLVVVDGYAVDCIPAPLPALGDIVDHQGLTDSVQELLRCY